MSDDLNFPEAPSPLEAGTTKTTVEVTVPSLKDMVQMVEKHEQEQQEAFNRITQMVREMPQRISRSQQHQMLARLFELRNAVYHAIGACIARLPEIPGDMVRGAVLYANFMYDWEQPNFYATEICGDCECAVDGCCCDDVHDDILDEYRSHVCGDDCETSYKVHGENFETGEGIDEQYLYAVDRNGKLWSVNSIEWD